jgi:hypothetical protein
MEDLIKRAATSLGFGFSKEEVLDRLVSTGVSKEDAYLAIIAARILYQEEAP